MQNDSILGALKTRRMMKSLSLSVLQGTKNQRITAILQPKTVKYQNRTSLHALRLLKLNSSASILNLRKFRNTYYSLLYTLFQ